MRSNFALGFAISAALAGALASRPACAAPQPLGMAILSAAVDENGKLNGGAGAVGAARKNPGVYVVRFNRNVEGCTYLATLGNEFSHYTGFISTHIAFLDFDTTDKFGVEVFVRNAGGSNDDGGFQLLVFCAQ